MAMFLILFGMSFVLMVITVILLSLLLRTEESSPVVRKTPRLPEPPRFFESRVPPSVPAGCASGVPVEALLLEIERHVRVERAAAESFHRSPTAQSLHVQTASRLVH
jgi:hypothetical protein